MTFYFYDTDGVRIVFIATYVQGTACIAYDRGRVGYVCLLVVISVSDGLRSMYVSKCQVVVSCASASNFLGTYVPDIEVVSCHITSFDSKMSCHDNWLPFSIFRFYIVQQ